MSVRLSVAWFGAAYGDEEHQPVLDLKSPDRLEMQNPSGTARPVSNEDCAIGNGIMSYNRSATIKMTNPYQVHDSTVKLDIARRVQCNATDRAKIMKNSKAVRT